MKYKGYIWKRRAEDLLLYPFILIGKILAAFDPLPGEYRVFYFFPFYHTGGAEKIHASVVKATGGEDAVIFFTRHSSDERFLQDFKDSGSRLYDISRYIDVPWLYFLKFVWRGKIAAYINKQKTPPIVFNGQSNFGYKISPWIKKEVKQVELIHSFNSFSWIRIPFLPFIQTTIMISRARIEAHLQQYRRLGVPSTFDKRIEFIANAIELPHGPCLKDFKRLKLLFVGRGTSEKRPELFVTLAREVAAAGMDATFTLAGDMPAPVLQSLPSNIIAIGNVSNADQLQELYCSHNVVMIPSETEGFPLVLMEAMAAGCAVIATPVGDIPYHVNNKNGLLLSSTDAGKVVEESVAWLRQLQSVQLQALSANAQSYAFLNFGIDRFNQQYKSILQL